MTIPAKNLGGSTPKRANLPERPTYVPNTLPETFIVPALKERIEAYFRLVVPQLVGNRVLDIGCGGQPMRCLLEGYGLDYSSLDAREQSNASIDWIASIDQPLTGKLSKEPPFDLLLCTEVLEHVLDWQVAFNNLSQLSKKGGFVILTAPFIFYLHETPFDFWRPTPFAFESLAQQFGFRVVKNEKLGSSIEVVGLICSHMLSSLYQTPKGLLHRLRLFFSQRMLRLILRLAVTFSQSSYSKIIFRNDQAFYISNAVVLQRL